MVPTTKEAQRAELHRTIWRIANDLRGSVDGWDFKAYVLGILFYRFISENLTAYINRGEHQAGEAGFDYALMSDGDAEVAKEVTVAEKGFYIYPSELFQNVRERASRDPNLNETLARVFKNIEYSAIGTDSENDLKGLFDDLDVNSSKLGSTVTQRNAKLVRLLDAVGEMPLGNFEDNTIDLFGDAYEYLMQMYASQAGKSGGEYYTPQEVSEVLARITVANKTRVNKVYEQKTHPTDVDPVAYCAELPTARRRDEGARLLDYVSEKLPAVAEHLDTARADLLAFTAFPKDVWVQIWSNNPTERLNKENRRRSPGRTDRRMGPRTPIPRPRRPRPLPPQPRHRHHHRGGHHKLPTRHDRLTPKRRLSDRPAHGGDAAGGAARNSGPKRGDPKRCHLPFRVVDQ